MSYITANTNGIASILEKDHNIPDPIILDAKFEQIKDEKFTRGTLLNYSIIQNLNIEMFPKMNQLKADFYLRILFRN